MRREALADDLIQQRFQRLPIAGAIEDDDRFVVQADLAPGQYFKKFVKRAEAARQDDKAIGAIEHDLLALVHAVDNDGLREAVMPHFGARQMIGNDADDLALGCQYGIGNFRHQADATGAHTSGNPLALASALEKLEMGVRSRPMKVAEGASHLFIVNPLSGRFMSRLFSTHPPIEERVRRLRDTRPNF